MLVLPQFAERAKSKANLCITSADDFPIPWLFLDSLADVVDSFDLLISAQGQSKDHKDDCRAMWHEWDKKWSNLSKMLITFEKALMTTH